MKPAAVIPVLLLAARSNPQPPDKERPPEPKAGSAAATLQAPIDRARQVEATLDAAAQARRDQVEDAGG